MAYKFMFALKALGHLPGASDFILMASQAMAWKMSAMAANQASSGPPLPQSPLANVNMAELSTVMGSNPAMLGLYLNNVPRHLINSSLQMLAAHGSGQSTANSAPHSSSNASLSPFISMSTHSMPALSGPVFSSPVTSGANPSFSGSVSVLNAQRNQLNNFYESLKMNAYLQPNRLMAQIAHNTALTNALTNGVNRKLELQLGSNDDSVPPQT